MLFTSDGLEQATRIEVATVHAARFASLSLATVHDLGCGIGADAITMSVLGVTVSAIDADPVTAAVADTNLRPWPESRARVGLVEDFVPPADAMRDRIGAWLDPARRVAGVADAAGRARRLHRLEDLSPSWSTVQAIAAAVPATGAKLALLPRRSSARRGGQWVSWEGDVVECALWWGPSRGGRAARLCCSARDDPRPWSRTPATTLRPRGRSLTSANGSTRPTGPSSRPVCSVGSRPGSVASRSIPAPVTSRPTTP